MALNPFKSRLRTAIEQVDAAVESAIEEQRQRTTKWVVHVQCKNGRTFTGIPTYASEEAANAVVAVLLARLDNNIISVPGTKECIPTKTILFAIPLPCKE